MVASVEAARLRDDPIFKRARKKLSQRDRQLIDLFGVGRPPWRPGNTFFDTSSPFRSGYEPDNLVERRAWDGAMKRFWDFVELDGAERAARGSANMQRRHEPSRSPTAQSSKPPSASALVSPKKRARYPAKEEDAVKDIKALVKNKTITIEELKGRIRGGRTQEQIAEMIGQKRGTTGKAIKKVLDDNEFVGSLETDKS